VKAPDSVNRNAKFRAKVTIQNRGNIAVSVANIEMRVAIKSVTSSQNVPAGSGIIRNIGPGQTKDVKIEGEAPNITGVGDLTAEVNFYGADDLRPEDNKYTTRLVVN
jgi:hypothetical protein